MCVSAAFLAVAGGTGVLPVTAHAGDAEILHRHLSWIVSVLELSLVAAVIAYVPVTDPRAAAAIAGRR